MELLKTGQKVSIFFEKGDSVIEIACTISKILEDRIVIELPPYFMRYIENLDTGCTLTVKAFSKIGTVDFNTIVITSPLEDEFSVELDYNATKLTPAEEIPEIGAIESLKISFKDKVYTVSTFAIATEYLRFYSDNEFNLEDTFDCELSLPQDCGIISFRGTITHVDPVYDNEFTLSYYAMAENDRQTLLYYMYLYSNSSN